MKSAIIQVIPIIDKSVRALCVKPYPGHPKGCPNFNHKKGCPPSAPIYDTVFDISEVYAIINVFDLKAHTDKMRELHPNWTQRQLECCLYWQPAARKEQDTLVKQFFARHIGENYLVNRCPEAMGVNITETLKNAGFELEWPPTDFACQVALAAKRIKTGGNNIGNIGN